MGKPSCGNAQLLISEYIASCRGIPGELKHLSTLEEKKTKVIPSVAASERGIAQTKELAPWGCRTSHMELQRCWLGEEVWKGPA